MTAKKFKSIAQAMEAHGIIRVEIDGTIIVRDVRKKNSSLKSQPKPFVDPNAPIPKSSPIQHKMDQVSSLLSMGDDELVNKLFPDLKEDEEV